MQGDRLPADEMVAVNRAGVEQGCHRCGTREPGTVSGNFVPEFHPPRVYGNAAVVTPSCLACSRVTGALVTMSLHRRL